MLGRLEVRSGPVRRIGKEIDRLDQDEGASLEGEGPVEYNRERRSITADVEYLAAFPQERTARDVGISERRWRDIVKGNAKPHRATAERIAGVAAQYRLSSNGSASATELQPHEASGPLLRQGAALRRSRVVHGV